MATHTVWSLNLDAEVELSRPKGYATRKALQDSMQPHFERAAELFPASAWVLGRNRFAEAPLPAPYRGAKGLCWCPTPTAIKALKEAGAEPIASPTVEVLARVNHRMFCAALGQTLPGACFVRSPSELDAVLKQASITGRWLCKRAFGFAGRGQRRMENLERADDRRWLNDCIEPGGLQVEPCVEIEREFSIHGVVRRDGAFSLGQVCQQFLDPLRFWQGAERIAPGTLSQADLDLITVEAERVAVALHQAGYFGPFGVDAFLWQEADGRSVLNPRSEINARLTMAFPVGMGSDWIEQLLAVDAP